MVHDRVILDVLASVPLHVGVAVGTDGWHNALLNALSQDVSGLATERWWAFRSAPVAGKCHGVVRREIELEASGAEAPESTRVLHTRAMFSPSLGPGRATWKGVDDSARRRMPLSPIQPPTSVNILSLRAMGLVRRRRALRQLGSNGSGRARD